MNPLGLYIDLPFCIARCAFCNFDVEGFRKERASQYIEALHQEISAWETSNKIKPGIPLTSIYLGGGTPSHFEAHILGGLLKRCEQVFSIEDGCEITLEAHPATLNDKVLYDLRQIGINRLSIGVQSFCDEQLNNLGRHHSAQDAIRAFHAARAQGFNNIGLDLIYGLPDQNQSDWQNTVQQAIALSPEHLSIYALSIEAGTLFARKQKEGTLKPCSEDNMVLYYDRAKTALADAGYCQYEISNFAKPSYACQHNLLYWNQDDILGVGISAHSSLGTQRYYNTSDISDYIRLMDQDQSPIVSQEEISLEAAQIDRIIFGLRKTEGIPSAWLQENPRLAKIHSTLKQQSLLHDDKHSTRLSHKGMHFADEVALAFI